MKKLFLLLICLSTSSAWAQRNLQNDKNNSFIEYTVYHSTHPTVGKNKSVTSVAVYDEAKQQLTGVAVSAAVKNFDSNNASRDSHMLEAVEALKFPTLKFASTSISPFKEGGKDKLNVKGNLTFHGVTKPVQFSALTWTKGNQVFVEGGFNTPMRLFGIEPPSYLLITTQDKIDIKFKMVFNK